MGVFHAVTLAPPDAILGLTEAYRADPNPDKINLSVGVYQDQNGVTPLLETVRVASQQVVAGQVTKSYLPIGGSPQFATAVQQLLLGAGHEAIATGRLMTAHTPGGTGALRVAADFIHQNFPQVTVWFTEPTWPNHPNVFQAAGVPTSAFPYFDAEHNSLDYRAFREAIRRIPAGDVVLLHGGCHNPTGIDPSLEQWQELAEIVAERGLLPLLDFAYQGFADGITEDAEGVRAFCDRCTDLIICSSFSKNFGLYRERVGALTMLAEDSTTAAAVRSQVTRAIRANYSNPPAHGAEIVTTILGDAALTGQWETEVAQMRERINSMRQLFVETLASKGVAGDYSFITRQRGMFSFSGLAPEVVQRLRERDSIYIVGSGRINVAGITPGNVDRLCSAIASAM